MITFQSVFSWISTVLTALCFIWLIGLGIFVLIRWIVLKVKRRKDMKEDLKHSRKNKKEVCEVDVKERKETVNKD